VSKTGADRQEMHERLRKHAMVAWEAVRNGDPNPLVESIPSDPELQAFLPVERLKALMDSSDYVGEAPRRAGEFAIQLREMLERGTNRSNWISE
jgi:adenylosuccinate lyase